MNKFHSTVSRRDFMKGLGLAGAGLGAAAASTPVFRDIDEAISAPSADWKRPWWVKERDYEDPTTEIDWSIVQRIDNSTTYCTASPFVAAGYRAGYVVKPGGDVSSASPVVADFMKSFKKTTKDYVNEKNPDWAGDTLRDCALFDSSVALQFGALKQPRNPAGGFRSIPTPEQRGVAKWSATPEENMRMIRAAGRLAGLRDVSCVELNSTTIKNIFSKNRAGKVVNFDSVVDYTEDDSSITYPNSCKWVISFNTQFANHLMRRSPAGPGLAAHKMGYARLGTGAAFLQEFLYGLGYMGFGSLPTIDVPWPILCGVAEKGRMGMNVVSPEYGAQSGVATILTDLPLAPVKPIDAGIVRFCESCGICAEMCPWDSIPKGESSWEPEWEINYPAPGFKGWRVNSNTCNYCTGCQGVCPFNSASHASAHALVRATSAVTPLFNGFFANMEEFMGFGGNKDPEAWWDMGDFTYGIDTTA